MRREVQLVHGRLHQPLPGAVEQAVQPHLGRPHVGIRAQPGAFETLGLAHPRGTHALAHRAGGLALPFRRELVVVDAWHLDKVQSPKSMYNTSGRHTPPP